jgi:hypothetical protein
MSTIQVPNIFLKKSFYCWFKIKLIGVTSEKVKILLQKIL